MSKYVVNQESDIWGNDRTVIRSAPTAYDVGSAIGAGIGMLVVANRNAKFRAAVSTGEAAQKYLANREYPKAITSANSLIAMADNEAQMVGHFFKGSAHEGLGQYDEAIKEYSITLDMAYASGQADSFGTVYISRGRCYLQKNALGPAMRNFTAYLRLEPNEDTGYFWQAMALTRLGDLDEALTNSRRAVSLNPGDGANYRQRADIYVRRGETERAIGDFSRAILLEPEDVTSYQQRADLYTEIKDDMSAIADYSRVIELIPDNADSYKNRAEAYKRIGETALSAADMTIFQEITARNAQKWETCETSWKKLPKPSGLFGGVPIVFFAIAMDPKSEIPFATSDQIPYNVANLGGNSYLIGHHKLNGSSMHFWLN